MENNKTDKILLRNNPVFIIFISCVVAAIMSLLGFLSYYNSDTRRTVEQIQINNLEEEIGETSIVPASETLDELYIDTLEKDITSAIDKHSDENEFSASELTDSALGL